jgi:Cys-tRNA synthase (O-phospho-L-seryl-tRNA:Cys-tRNA synthase)
MGTESITKFNEYNERLNKYNAIKKLYTDPILHRKLMTFETEHFNILSEDDMKEMEISLRKDKIKKFYIK